jgi:hypothetical protein
MNTAGRPLNKRISERLAACETVGLHYWADHPAAGHVWAVDDQQRAHVVRIHRDGAEHVCRSAYIVAIEQCDGANVYTSNLLEDRDIR